MVHHVQNLLHAVVAFQRRALRACAVDAYQRSNADIQCQTLTHKWQQVDHSRLTTGRTDVMRQVMTTARGRCRQARVSD